MTEQEIIAASVTATSIALLALVYVHGRQCGYGWLGSIVGAVCTLLGLFLSCAGLSLLITAIRDSA